MTLKLVTRFQTETFADMELRSRFVNLQQILTRTQFAQRDLGERTIALASLETVEAEMNRRAARVPTMAP